jgi:hypothetical protein
MPSLFKYFALVGSLLLGLLFLVNHLAGPQATDGRQAAAPAPKVAVQHDPRASAVERWRNELAAMRGAEQAQSADNASTVVKSAPEPAKPTSTALKTPEPKPTAQPVQTVAAPVQPTTAAPATPTVLSAAASLPVATETTATIPASAVAAQPAAHDDEAAAKVVVKKTKTANRKAAKAKLARERAAARVANAGYGQARERYTSNYQDQYYYGQRAASLYPQAPGYAYAPRQNYGPFGWGRGW